MLLRLRNFHLSNTKFSSNVKPVEKVSKTNLTFRRNIRSAQQVEEDALGEDFELEYPKKKGRPTSTSSGQENPFNDYLLKLSFTSTHFDSKNPRLRGITTASTKDNPNSIFYGKDNVESAPKPSLPQRLAKVDEEKQLEDINENLQERYARQYEIETRAYDKALEEYRTVQYEVIKLKRAANLGAAKKMLVDWYTPLREVLAQEQLDLLSGKFAKPGYNVFGKFLLMLTPEKLTVVTMHVVLGHLIASAEGVTMTDLSISLGRAVQAEVNLMRLKNEEPSAYKHLLKNKPIDVHKVNYRSLFLENSKWPLAVLAHVGSELIRNLLETANVETFEGLVPAFSHVNRFEKNRNQGYIVANQLVYQNIEDDIEAAQSIRRTSDVRMFPMIVPPRPWVAPSEGGYLTRENYLMRTKEWKTQSLALETANLHEIYQALNILGSTPWRLNKDVYKVVLTVWENGGGMADLPSRKDHEYPPEPESLEDKVTWIKTMKRLQQKNSDLHSLRCDINLKLGVASDFMNDPMYFAHNLDFRGRAYPIPPHLNHLGADICRGLLAFFEGKPLGKNGFEWVKIHMANVFGKNKLSFEDRVKFTESQMDNIIDSAKNPLDGKQWWLQGENPWQCLATCFEIHKILECDNPETYVSYLPIHQDGTCNGLQHYAALGGDILGGQQVNLLPSDKPQDVYSGVADIVSKFIEERAQKGEQLAIQLRGKVSRPIIKQTVMTSVYGVTFIGARAQIQNAMKDRELFTQDEDLQYQASSYLAKLTFDALKEMFLGARLIMDWLTTCARLIAKSGQTVRWHTPMGLPVVQPYRINTGSKEYIKTILQTMCLVKQSSLPVHISRQQSAFPPNYIHSLDSTHMMKTAQLCHDKGITYASVHDSYWTHASTVDHMNQLLREAFIWLHERPLLDDLLTEFQQAYPEIEFPPLPPKGDLELHKVAQSRYFFN